MDKKSKYKTEYVEQAYKLALLGAKDTEIADFFGVTERTITNWKNAHPDFYARLQEGKNVADANVAYSLYNKAIGGIKIKEITERNGVKTETIKELAPDTLAAMYWLNNRQRGKFSAKPQPQNDTETTKIIHTDNLDDNKI